MEDLNKLDPVAGDVHPVLGRRPLLPRGLAGRRATAARRWTRWSRVGHDRRLGLLRVRHAVARGRPRRPASHPETYFDSADDHHRPGPARPVAGGPREGPHDRRDPAAGGAPGDDGPADPRRRRGGRRAGRSSSPGDLLRVRPGDKVPVDGVRRRGRVGGRRVDAHRRADPGHEGGRRRGHRRDHQHHRLVRDARDARRPRHRARPDRRAGRAGPGLQGADPAARRPDQPRCSSRRCSSWRVADVRRSGSLFGPGAAASRSR